MHISEGLMSAPVLAGGAALAVAGMAVGLKSLRSEDIPRASILSAVFFVASLIHVPIGPSSAHLVLNGLIGTIMGWAAFPIIFMGLLLQGLLFNFGGLTTLGLNTFNMAAPAVLFGVMLRPIVNSQQPWLPWVAGFLGGGLPVLASAILVAIALYLSGEQFKFVALQVIAGNLPVIIIESVVVMFCVKFLKKVCPEILDPGASNALEGVSA
ncbi:MAG: cobalt transporter CbiM [Deltaproteobacteria bacterium]|jgi:cobalt/nickel transport system permease protein|nr:cobalt transporter CbiM [Deltaproteobacteria bacterium]